ncbi:MAG TPA: trypsin-like serine protease [Polyangia bacterium]|jgi:hypothetical protein|nr:trypsin-like serine protease [Polyangia bacterium]
MNTYSKASTSWLLRAGLGLALTAALVPACGDITETPEVADRTRELIGGFAANDPTLDAIGSLVVQTPFGNFQFCGATVIAPESVLTAKHCAQLIPLIYSSGDKLVFSLGPNVLAPRRTVEIVGFELAPGDMGGFVGVGRDAAVLHLDSPITDVQPVDIAQLNDGHVGLPFAAIGYGIRDNTAANGERRLGKQTLRSRHGKILETMFGSFENFFDWFLTGKAPALAARPGLGQPPSPEDLARQLYDETVLLEDYEIVTGGAPGDAQPCFGDSGSSLIRRRNGRFVSYGVVSGGVGSVDSICDLGAVYASFGPEVFDFIQTAKTWTDPCGDLGSQGVCAGDVALRCTNLAEGRRRVVEFDCASLGMTCQMSGAQVSCDGIIIDGPPRPTPRPGPKADVRELEKQVFSSGLRQR